MGYNPKADSLPRVLEEELAVSISAVATLYEILIDTGVISRDIATTRLQKSISHHGEGYTSEGLKRLVEHLAKSEP